MNKSRRMRWTENVAFLGDKIDADSAVVERPEGKRPLGKKLGIEGE
jgi:hypothetical protein